MKLANCMYCGEPGLWGKAHATCVAVAGQGRRELRAAIQAALTDDFSMGAIQRIVSDIAQRSGIPGREMRAVIVEEYLCALDRQVNAEVYDVELQDRLEELRNLFALSRWECMRAAA